MRITVSALAGLALVVWPGLASAERKGGDAAANDEAKVICKRFRETGSLVKTRKQCMTQADWDRVSASQREGSRRMIEELSTRPCGSPETC